MRSITFKTGMLILVHWCAASSVTLVARLSMPFMQILGIANGLHYLHTYERPIIHGDIKGVGGNF